jgi:serine protease
MIRRSQAPFGPKLSSVRCLVAVGLLVAMAIGAAPPPAAAAAPSAEFRDGSLIVAFRPGTAAAKRQADVAAAGAEIVRTFRSGAVLLSVPKGRVVAAAKTLRAQGDVRFAEPDYLMTLSASPNDPSFPVQWAYQNTGQTVDGVAGTPGADEKAVAAWSVTTGTRSIVIAEVDSGVDYNHPDLAANIWTNPGGIGGCPAGTHGYNVLNHTCDPMDDETYYGSHGTHVAGILGAVGNNGIGVTGVNWTTTILPVKWVNAAGDGSTSDLLLALDWVLAAQDADVNVRVVNDSAVYRGTASSQALSDEIALLGQHDVLFVTPAGNTAEDNDNPATPRYPCNYDLPNLICVAASDQHDSLPIWANWGATSVDLAAPGENILSTKRNGTYGFMDGSSMASPQVAGTAALILATGNMSATALKARILDNVDPLPSLAGKVLTGGRLNVCKAVPGCTYTLSGTVKAGATGVVGAIVYVFKASDSSYAGNATTTAGGAYTLSLQPGHYKLWVQTNLQGYPDQAYGPDGTFANATSIDLTGGNATVNVVLAPGP